MVLFHLFAERHSIEFGPDRSSDDVLENIHYPERKNHVGTTLSSPWGFWGPRRRPPPSTFRSSLVSVV